MSMEYVRKRLSCYLNSSKYLPHDAVPVFQYYYIICYLFGTYLDTYLGIL